MMSSLCKEVKVHLTDFINRFHFCNNSHSNMTPLPPHLRSHSFLSHKDTNEKRIYSAS